MLHVIYGLESRSLTPCHSGRRTVGCRNESGHLFVFSFFVDLRGLCMRVNLVKPQATVSRYPGHTARLEKARLLVADLVLPTCVCLQILCT